MKIKLIAIGKVKEPYLINGIDEYKTRLLPYVNIEIIEEKDEAVNDDSPSSIERAKNIEASRVLKLIKDRDYVINLDMNKKELDSIEFSSYLDKKFMEGGSNITFVIGGSYGLGDELKKRANDSISLSKMTFLHQMTRLILLEQIYRAFKIKNHEVYHK